MADISKHLEKAAKHLQKGQTEPALGEYMRALEQDPFNETAALAAAELMAQLGRRAEAQAVLSRLLDVQLSQQNPAVVQTWKKLTRAGRATPDQALKLSRLVVRTDPKLALEALRGAAPVFLHAGRKHDALTAYDMLIALDPSRENLRRYAELCAELGNTVNASQTYLRLGNLDAEGRESIDLFRRAHELDQSNMDAALAFARAVFARNAAGDAEIVVRALAPLASLPDAPEPVRTLYGQALLATGRTQEAGPFIIDAFERVPRNMEPVITVLRALLSNGQDTAAIEMSSRFELAASNAGRRRECVGALKTLADLRPPRVAFLEHLAELFNAASYEQDYCRILLQLFELFFAAGNFLRAAECLERSIEVDAYEPGHQQRLEMLRAKIEPKRFQAIATRLGMGEVQEPKPSAWPEQDEPTVLEDLILQAEFFLQYKLPSRAAERLERIRKLFPDEEENNVRLRKLYLDAGIGLSPARGAGPVPEPVARLERSATVAAGPMPASQAELHHLARISEIIRNIQRQGSVKSVLFTAVNDIGREWQVGRCLALLATPGKAPSLAMEYCAPGLRQSDIRNVVKLLGMLQPLVIVHGPLAVVGSGDNGRHAPLRRFAASLGIESLLAMSLLDGDQHAGLLILCDCGSQREWSESDITLLKTLCDQVALAVSNARLRGLVRDLSLTEERSGLLKRASYVEVLLTEVRRALEQESTVSLIMLEFAADYEIARLGGEAAAEGLMQHIGQLVSSNIRQNDLAFRYDAATVAVLMADANEQAAQLAAEKLRRVIASLPMPGSDTPPRASAAVVEAVMERSYDPADVVTELINRAEDAIAGARSAGPAPYVLPSPWKDRFASSEQR